MKFNWIPLSVRFILLLLLQVIIFKRIQIDWSILSFGHVIIYPLWVMLAPIKIPKSVLLIGAFIMGLTIDMFYDSPGVHAAALVFTAFLRDFILKIIEPDKGYNIDRAISLKQLGFLWFISYAGIFMLIHLFFYFSVEAFSFIYMYEIIMSTFISLIISVIIMIAYSLIDNPA